MHCTVFSQVKQLPLPKNSTALSCCLLWRSLFSACRDNQQTPLYHA